jgi:hypothetical protein
MCKLINKIINKIMAQFTINHNGLPLLQANNITIDVPIPPPTVPVSFIINPLTNDQLGYTPTIIDSVELPVFSDEFATISENGLFISLDYYYYDDVLEEWVPHVMGTTFDYTIKDAFDRESTATVTLNYL